MSEKKRTGWGFWQPPHESPEKKPPTTQDKPKETTDARQAEPRGWSDPELDD